MDDLMEISVQSAELLDEMAGTYLRLRLLGFRSATGAAQPYIQKHEMIPAEIRTKVTAAMAELNSALGMKADTEKILAYLRKQECAG